MTDDQIERLICALKEISRGPTSGPLGLEAVAMAIGGEGKPGDSNVADGLTDIADKMISIADAIDNLADAVRQCAPE